MATAINLSSETSPSHIQPECDHASCCYWFETVGSSSSRCANRHSMVCRKRLDDLFAPYDRDKQSALEQ